MPKQSKNVKSGRMKKRKRTFTSGWAANVLKSLGYSSYDVIADLMPNTVEFGRQIKDAKDELDDALGIAKDKAKGLTSQAKTEFDKIKDKDLKDAIEDIKSGKFYNKDRMTDSFGDFGFGDDDFGSFDTSDEDFDSFDVESSNPDTNVLVNANIDEDNPMVQAQEVTSATVAKGAELVSRSNKESSVIVSSAITKIGVGITDQLQLMNSEVAKISSTLPKTIAEQAALTTKFYEESLGYQKTISDTITELKTLYVDSKKVVGGDADKRHETSFGHLGYGVDFEGYKKVVKNNIKSAVNDSAVGSMLSMALGMMKTQKELGDDGKGLAAKTTTAILKTLLPKGVKKSATKLDDFLSTMMLPIGMKLGKLQDRWDSPMLQNIGKLFGISAKPNMEKDKSEYEKGAVAFDGKVHRAITDVIPTYLRMIASAVTGKEEVAFDYEKGVYDTVENIKKNFDSRVRSSTTRDFFSEKYDFGKFVDKIEGVNDKQRDDLKNTFEEFLNKAVLSGDFVNFRVNKDGSDDIARFTGLSSDDPSVQLIRRFFEGYIDSGRAKDLNEIFSNKMIQARDNAEKTFQQMTRDALTNNYYLVDNGLDTTGNSSPSARVKGVKSLASDIYGRDQNSYLRDILGTLATGIKVVNVATMNGSPQSILDHSRHILDSLNLDVQEYNTSQASTGSDEGPVRAISYDDSQISDILSQVLTEEREKDGLDKIVERLNNNNKFLREDNFIGKMLKRIQGGRNSINQAADNISNSIANQGIDLIYGRRPSTGSGDNNDPNNPTTGGGPDDGVGNNDESPIVSASNVPSGDNATEYNSSRKKDRKSKRKNRRNERNNRRENGSIVSDINDNNESPIATITENQIELANNASAAIRDITRVGGDMTQQVNSLNDALFGEDGLVDQIQNNQSQTNQNDDHPVASKVKEDILKKAKKFVLGEKDENGNYKDGLLSDVANGAKSMKSEITKFSHDLIYGSEDGAQIGMIGYMKKFFGSDKDGKLNISGKVKEFGAEFKDHFKARAKEWTSMIFGEEEASAQEKFNTFMGDMKGKKGLIGAASAIGVLGSFFLPGGPIGGALLGAGAGIVSQSTQLKDFLFGKEDPNDDGKRKDGLIPEKFQSFFKDNKKRLTIGAGVGLLGSFFLPGGPVGGALIGGALSIATKSKTFSDMLYGENGDKEDPTGGIVGTINKFIKKNYSKDKNVKSTFLDAGIGAGAGLIGSFFLPGGPILGSLIGAGASIALNTDKFKDFFFGKEDPEDDGKRKGGVFGKYKDMIVEKAEEAQDKLSLWMEENITNPLKVSLDPIKEKIKKEAKQFLFGKEDEEGNKKGGLIGAIADRVDKSAFGDLKKAVKENIIDKMKDGFNKIFGGFFKLVGSIIKSPITALTAVAESINKENNDEDAPSIADRIEELNRKSREKFQQKLSAKNKTDEDESPKVSVKGSYNSSKKKNRKEKRYNKIEERNAKRNDKNTASSNTEEVSVEEVSTASTNSAEIVADATEEVKDETAKVADNTEAIRDLTQTQIDETERSTGILSRIENTLSNALGSVKNSISGTNNQSSEDNVPQAIDRGDNSDSENFDAKHNATKSSRAKRRIERDLRGKIRNEERNRQEWVSNFFNSSNSNENTDNNSEASPTASTSLTSLIGGNPDDSIGKNVEKIAKSVDGQLNGTGYNLNRIYKLLKRRLGKGMGDDEDGEDIGNGKFKGTIGSRIWSAIKNPRKILEGVTGFINDTIGKAFTTVKDFIIGGVKKVFSGVINAGKALLNVPKMIIGGVKKAIPAIGQGIANVFNLGATLLGNGLRALGNVIENGAKGFGNLISGALTGFGELAQGLGILGKEALTLLAKGGAVAITGVAKAGAFIAKGAVNAVGSLFKRRKKGKGTDNGAIATHVIIDGGNIDYVDRVDKIGEVDKVVSGGKKSSSGTSEGDESAKVIPFPRNNQPDTTTGEASPDSAAAALTGGFNSIKDSLRSFGESAKTKGSNLIDRVKGSAENIRDKFKKEDSEEEQKTFREKLLGLVQRNTEGTEQHHSVWSSIFSKKGLITAGLILMAPLIIKAVKGLINFFGSDLGKGLLESVKNLVGELGDRVSDEGGLVGVANNAGELATQVTDGIGLTKKESYVIDEETGAILTDENGNPITKTDSKAKGSLMNLFTPKKAKVDHETGEVYESREFDHSTETLGTAAEAVWKKKIVKSGKNVLKKYAKKNGLDKPKTFKQYASVAKTAFTDTKGKITKVAEGVNTVGGKVKNSKIVQSAVSKVSESDTIKTATTLMKKALDFVVDKFGGLAKKFGAKGGSTSKIASIVKKLTSKIFDADIIKGFMPKISKILGKVATAAGTLLTSEAAWFALGALGGATNPGELFEVNMDDVEEGKTKALMRAIAAVYKGLANTSAGSWFDLICDIVQEVSGFNLAKVIATNVFNLFSGENGENDLSQAQSKFDEGYTDYVQEEYDAYKKNQEEAGQEAMSFEEFQQSDLATSRADYNKEINPSLGKRVWDGVKKVGSGVGKVAKAVLNPIGTIKDTLSSHKETGWFEADGSYYVKSSASTKKAEFYNYYNVNGDLVDVVSAEEVDNKIKAGQLSQSEVKVKSNLSTNAEAFRVLSKRLWDEGTEKAKELWEKAKKKAKDTITKPFVEAKNTFFAHKDTGWFDTDGSYYVKSSNSGTRIGEYYNHYNVNGDLIGVSLADEVDEKINTGQLTESEVKVKSNLATNIDTIKLSAKTVWEAGKNKIKGLWDKAKEKVNNLGKKISENPIAKYILPNRKTALATPEGNYYIKGSNGYDYYNSNGSMIAANIPEDVVTDMLESGQLVETEKWTSNEAKRKVSELIHMGVTTISDVITLRKDTFNALKDTLTENTKYWTESIKEHGVLGAVMNFFVKKREVALYDVKGGYYVQNKDGTYNYFNINGDLVSENVPQEDVNDMMSQGLLTEGEIVEDSDAKEAISKIQSKVKTLWEEAKTKGIQAVDNLMGWLGLKEPETTKTSDSESAKASTTSAGKGDSSKVETTSKSGIVNGQPYYSQNDPSIKNKTYNLSDGKSGTMGDNGCGPTAMAMVASQVTGQPVDPTTMANVATSGGYSVKEGTTPEYFNAAAASIGIGSNSVIPTKENIKTVMNSGHPVIIQGQSNGTDSPFTSEGHYVVGVGINGNNIVINDPRGRKYSKEYAIESIVGGAQNMWEFYDDASEYYDKAKAVGSTIKNSRVIKNTADALSNSNSEIVKSAIGFMKKALDFIVEKLGALASKFHIAKNGATNKISSVINKVTSKILDIDIVKKFMPNISKIMGKVSAAASTLMASELVAFGVGALGGATNPGDLFEVNMDDIAEGTSKALMRAIAGVFKGLLNTTVGSWFDLACEIVQSISGVNLVKIIANTAFNVFASEENELNLNEAQSKFDKGYTDYVSAEYEAYKQSQENAGKKAVSFEEFKSSGLATSRDDYNSQINPSLAKRAWDGLKGFASNIFGKKDNTQNSAQASTTSAGKGDNKIDATSKSGIVNGFPYYSQNDPAIKDKPYNLSSGQSDTMGDRGCGPTAMSMIASQLTGRNIDPTIMANMATAGGYSIDEGTTPEYFGNAAASLGINSSNVPLSKDSIRNSLMSGNPMILQGADADENSPFTSEGHYVVGVGINGDNIIVNDPRGRQYSREYKLSDVMPNIQNAWSFSNNQIPSSFQFNGNYGGKDGEDSSETTSEKLRSQVVAAIRSREGQNSYTQSNLRTKVDSGYGDCSSTVRWAYQTGANIDPGGYSEAQYISSIGVDVDNTKGGPNEANLKPGDLLFYDRGNPSRKDGVGHVEMYIGAGNRMGHGSGIGPRVSALSTDGARYLKARRFITDSSSDYDMPSLTAANINSSNNNSGTSTSGDSSDSDNKLSDSTIEKLDSETQESSSESQSVLDLILGGIEAFTKPITDWMTGNSSKASDNVTSEDATASTNMTNTNGTIGTNDSSATASDKLSSFGNIASLSNNAINVANATNSGLTGSFANITNISNDAVRIATGGDYLGKYTEQFESGGRGPATISTGVGDKGGVSFGTYQFATYNQPQVNSDSPLATFWNTYYASKHPGVVPGNNDAFKQAWVQEANADPETFKAREAAFFGNNYYNTQAKKLSDIVDVDNYDRGFQEQVFATSVHYGADTPVLVEALSGKNVETMRPEDVINTVEDYKASTVNRYFKSSSDNVKKGLLNRFNNTERNQMLQLANRPTVKPISDSLKTENNGSPIAGKGGDNVIKIGSSGTMDRATNVSKAVEQQNAMTALDNSLLSKMVELLGYIVNNTSNMDGGIKELCGKDFGSSQTNVIGGTTHNNIIPVPQQTESNNKSETNQQYSTAKMISAGLYLT